MTILRLHRVSCVALVVCIALIFPVNFSIGQTTKSPDLPDGGWPRSYKTADGATIVVYQPQIDSWDNREFMVAWAAVSYLPQGATQPALGTIKIEADTRVALDQRLVDFSNFRITEFKFPSLDRDQ